VFTNSEMQVAAASITGLEMSRPFEG